MKAKREDKVGRGVLLKVSASGPEYLRYEHALWGASGGSGRAIFPRVSRRTDGSLVYVDDSGNDLCAHTCSLETTTIPSSEWKRFFRCINGLHKIANDEGGRYPEEYRNFIKSFRLPDPKTMPEAYRLEKGLFRKRLHVLWGYEADDAKNSSLLPMSSNVLDAWGDKDQRTDMAKVIPWDARKLILPLLLVFISMALVAVFVCFRPGFCFAHKEFYLAECREMCVKCGGHTDADGGCSDCVCETCGRHRKLRKVDGRADCRYECADPLIKCKEPKCDRCSKYPNGYCAGHKFLDLRDR